MRQADVREQAQQRRQRFLEQWAEDAQLAAPWAWTAGTSQQLVQPSSSHASGVALGAAGSKATAALEPRRQHRYPGIKPIHAAPPVRCPYHRAPQRAKAALAQHARCAEDAARQRSAQTCAQERRAGQHEQAVQAHASVQRPRAAARQPRAVIDKEVARMRAARHLPQVSANVCRGLSQF